MTAEQPEIHELFQLACRARENAWSPYSRFAVGAALETEDGTVFSGCNVENGSFGLSICAERVAITKAVSEGHRKIKRIVVVAQPLASPCGACRQFLSEFMDDDGHIVALDPNESEAPFSWTMSELLPNRFHFEKPEA